MHKVNTAQIVEVTWASPKGKFIGAGKEVSEALGRKPESTDLNERHPFDVEILRIPPGKAPYSYHMHSAQWEFYHVISGRGVVRHKDGTTPIEAGDAFLFKPGEPHQITNDTAADMLLYVLADNPIGDSGLFRWRRMKPGSKEGGSKHSGPNVRGSRLGGEGNREGRA
jgi:mannose-6-phosphate isomerase-like protein (cupin superfamily)